MQDKLNGIFTVVDEQCKFPKATDMTLAEGIRRFHSGNALFKSIIDKPDCFTIGHYAGDVVYCSIGFLEKSKLTISEGIINIAKSSTLPFFKGFFSKYSEGIGVQKANSTGYRFCKRLDDLVLELERSAVFFIKCLRSNYSFSEYSWDREAVRAQLLASGIPQALKVAKSVLPAKLRYEDVYNKYYILLGYEKRARVTGDPPSIAKMILSVAGITKGFATGRTLMLLDAEAVSISDYEKTTVANFQQSSKLEELRIEKISRTVVILQKNFRAFLARKYYIKQKKAAITLQSGNRTLLRFLKLYLTDCSCHWFTRQEIRC